MSLIHLTHYPVKSMQGHALTAAHFGAQGLEGDRRWAVIYASGAVATRRELPALAGLTAVNTETGITISFGEKHIEVPFPSDAPTDVKVFSTTVKDVQDAGNIASLFVSCALQSAVRLVYFPDQPLRPVKEGFDADGHFTGFADEFPVLIASMASLRALNAELAAPVDIQRFRANVVVDGDFAPWAEDTWRRIQIGSTVLRLVEPCARCIMVTQDPMTGAVVEKGEPLKTLRRIHPAHTGKIMFGQNAVVEQQGTMTLADEVKILETGPSKLLPPE